MNIFIRAVDIFFALGMFINAMLFIPQAIRIYKLKHSRDVSLTTFGGFLFIQLASIVYGYVHKDYLLFFGFLLSIITCGTVTILILKYRGNNG